MVYNLKDKEPDAGRTIYYMFDDRADVYISKAIYHNYVEDNYEVIVLDGQEFPKGDGIYWWYVDEFRHDLDSTWFPIDWQELINLNEAELIEKREFVKDDIICKGIFRWKSSKWEIEFDILKNIIIDIRVL